MSQPSPRLTLARPDLADAALEGVVAAARYRSTEPMQVSAPVVPLRRAPEPDAEQVSQLLFGEGFAVLEIVGDWAFGQSGRDGYVGWADAAGLSAPVLAPSHRITALRTYAFSEPHLKSAPVGLYALNALVTIEAEDGPWRRAARAGWIYAPHIAPVGEGFADDPAGVAERFLGAPYLWGGRESLGLDCSGLIQAALDACGRGCPRDSDMQQALGYPLEVGVDLKGLRRNDLVFWRGHVGIMLDDGRLLHANAHHMAVAIEPLTEAVARIEAAGSGPPTAFRRL